MVWALAARPKTLTLSLAPVAVATALALHHGAASLTVAGWAAAGAICIQIGTNLINDWADAARGADGKDRLGPLRITASGLRTPVQVQRASAVAFGAALICGAALVVRGGWPIVWVGVASLLAGYGYTAGPYPLAYHGMGELFAGLFFGPVAVGTTYWLETGRLSGQSLWLGTALGSLAAAVLAINNLRDQAQDAAAGKTTLAVRWGLGRARPFASLLVVLPFVIVALQVAAGALPQNSLGALVLVPSAWQIVRACAAGQGSHLTAALVRTVQLQAALAAILAAVLSLSPAAIP